VDGGTCGLQAFFAILGCCSNFASCQESRRYEIKHLHVSTC